MLRVGVAGVGRGMGPAAMFDLMPDCKLVAICDPNPEALVRTQKDYPDTKGFSTYEDMLDSGLDIVVVGTPIPLHAEQTIAALRAGCHVLQEVTLSNTIAGCFSILDEVKKHPNLKFMLAENTCYWGYILAWTKMWKDGMFGDFLYGECEYIHDIRNLFRNDDGSLTWRANRPAIHYCTHSLGPIAKVTGERFTSVSCLGTDPKLEAEINQNDFMVAIFKTSSGGVVKMLRSQSNHREPPFHYYSLYGTKGCVETTRQPITPTTSNAWFSGIPHLSNMIHIPIAESVKDVPEKAISGGHGSLEYLMVKDFIDSIREDRPSPIDINMALDMTLPGLYACESAMNGGQPVQIPDWRVPSFSIPDELHIPVVSLSR